MRTIPQQRENWRKAITLTESLGFRLVIKPSVALAALDDLDEVAIIEAREHNATIDQVLAILEPIPSYANLHVAIQRIRALKVEVPKLGT